MLKIYLLFIHVLATCTVIGTIVLSDVRMLAKVVGYKVIVAPPSRLEAQAVMAGLALLSLSGAALVALGLEQQPDFLANGKFLAKLVLVTALAFNGLVMHRKVFSQLLEAGPVSRWPHSLMVKVSFSVGLSNSVWLYVVFLGLAKPWNFIKPMAEVLAIAVALWLVAALVVYLLLRLAAVEAPRRGHTRWTHSVKAALSGFGGLDEPQTSN
jgi:hypothetical protein